MKPLIFSHQLKDPDEKALLKVKYSPLHRMLAEILKNKQLVYASPEQKAFFEEPTQKVS